MKTALIHYDPQVHESPLLAWVCAPHVTQWWGPTSLHSLIETADGGEHRIIAFDNTPIGFIRWHPLTREELDAAGLVEIRTGGYDIDLLIGETRYLGRGIGTSALQLAEAHLIRQYQPPFLSLCSNIHNTRAIACYQNAGFTIVRAFHEAGHEAHYFLSKALGVKNDIVTK